MKSETKYMEGEREKKKEERKP